MTRTDSASEAPDPEPANRELSDTSAEPANRELSDTSAEPANRELSDTSADGERSASPTSSPDVTIACAAVAAFGAGFSGLAPTGTWWWDPVVVAVMAAAFVIAATRAHRNALFLAVAIATVFVGFSAWFGVALVGCVAFAASTQRPQHRRGWRAAAGMATILALTHLAEFGFFGLSALLAAVAVIAVFASAFATLDAGSAVRLKRVAMWVGGFFAIVGIIATVQLLAVRSSANAGVEAARSGLASARAGDTQQLSRELARAQIELDKTNAAVSSPLLLPLKLVPVAAQHLQVAATASAFGSTVATEARDAAVNANLEDLTLRQGQFDLDLLASMGPSLNRAATSLAEAVQAIDDDRSPWLLGPVDARVESLVAEIADILPEAQLAAQAVAVMPEMLGANGERRYLMLFGSPAEAREFGGFVGGYAVISIRDGNLDLIAAGGVNDIVPVANLGALADPESYPVEYEAADPALFPQNLTSTPSISTIARAVRDIFPELLGAPIDGVVYLDPYALAAMTEITGPVDVDGIGEALVGDDITDFIFDGQYRIFDDRDVRFEAMGALAQATATAFADTDLPGPEALGRLLGPVARAGRLQVITYDDAENAFLNAVQLQRAFVAPTSIDSFAVLHTNGTASKLDLYLHRDIRYDVTVDGDQLTAVVDVELRSEIPPGVPELTYGFTNGTNEALLSLYSPHELTLLTVNGEPHEYVTHTEFGFFRYALFKIALAPNEVVQVRFEVVGAAPEGPYRLGVWQQPTVNNDHVEIVYRTPGSEPVSARRELVEGWLFDPLVWSGAG